MSNVASTKSNVGNNVEATFDIVAKKGNNVERVLRWNFVLSTKSNVASTLLPETATGNKVERCFDIVAGVDRALWVCLFATEAEHKSNQYNIRT